MRSSLLISILLFLSACYDNAIIESFETFPYNPQSQYYLSNNRINTVSNDHPIFNTCQIHGWDFYALYDLEKHILVCMDKTEHKPKYHLLSKSQTLDLGHSPPLSIKSNYLITRQLSVYKIGRTIKKVLSSKHTLSYRSAAIHREQFNDVIILKGASIYTFNGSEFHRLLPLKQGLINQFTVHDLALSTDEHTLYLISSYGNRGLKDIYIHAFDLKNLSLSTQSKVESNCICFQHTLNYEQGGPVFFYINKSKKSVVKGKIKGKENYEK
ncbi:hypothetical protein [Pseudoalteromonas sp. Of7M-16]|uniref:hypothetical protein n=1 Tax=Pseudoalteromonas sp. Of7M-16 TaxID=2917756 RepID=UPI001EF6D2F5|nr:hypothetical protein [Pseudoalteromonas sp. Of7M-16]MCG7547810.1 hypothetical protein [Pseudoalteromonas sp. Of7M-16]